ncbi:MAG: hypothetical protein ACI89E_000514 [Planctomycetota bacterium]|jgi:hypothetical protein
MVNFTTIALLSLASLTMNEPAAIHGGAAYRSPGPQTPPPIEADFYRLVDMKPQAGLKSALGDLAIEVGGLCFLGNESLLAATRRGEVWMVKDYASDPKYSLWADGLHEPLGLLAHNGWIYYAQRGDLSRMRDSNEDGRADEFEVVNEGWSTSGDYHEYAFGPCLDAQGNFWVTLNRPFGGEPFGKADFRGWAARISPDGETCEMVASGLRSPAGIGRAPWGELFYTDNQGEWVGTNKLTLLQPGDFHGHPWGIESSELLMSKMPYPIPTRDYEERYRNGILFPDAVQEIEDLVLPSIWFPYDKLGRSASGFDWDESGGEFGPFDGQLFVGDQYEASVIRVALEKVDGHWQGAAFPFRKGLASGVIRARFDREDWTRGMTFGMSDRGWTSIGTARDGLQRLEWTGETPFEIQTMTVLPDGFRLKLTRPCDASLVTPEGFQLTSYTYQLHEAYGSPEMDTAKLMVSESTVSADGLTIDLVVGSGAPQEMTEAPAGTDSNSTEALHPSVPPIPAPALRIGYVHELHAHCLRDAETKHALLHADAYYTLNRLPKD